MLAAGESALPPLWTQDKLRARPALEQHVYLEGRRGELYSLASVIADATIARAWEERTSFPPYGLARSLFTQLRAVSAAPGPFEQGSIGSFKELGQAYVDTLVFYLQRELTVLRTSEQAWMVARLDQLLRLFRIRAGSGGQSRLRDPFSFLYGGLHFGASVCIELVEVMARIVDGEPLTAAGKADTIRRSYRVAHQLAGLNLADVPPLYWRLHRSTSPNSPGDTWLSPADFHLVPEDDEGPRIAMRAHVLRMAGAPSPADSEPRYRTRGCPARASVSGGRGAIATMWNWAADLSVATDLLRDSGAKR